MTTYLGTFEISHIDAQGRVFMARTPELLDAAIAASDAIDAAFTELAEVNA